MIGSKQKLKKECFFFFFLWFCRVAGWTMKKGVHPQMQWISYVTQSGRLMHVMMTRIHHVGKVYHFGAKRQLAQSIGQIAKFKRRFNELEEEPSHENNIDNQKK